MPTGSSWSSLLIGGAEQAVTKYNNDFVDFFNGGSGTCSLFQLTNRI
jgi:hypothetical protein